MALRARFVARRMETKMEHEFANDTERLCGECGAQLSGRQLAEGWCPDCEMRETEESTFGSGGRVEFATSAAKGATLSAAPPKIEWRHQTPSSSGVNKMKNLYAILLLVGTCCAQSIGSGHGSISGSFIDGPGVGQADIALPDFAVVDGSPLQLPIGVNPLAYLSAGAPTHTIYIGDTAHGCPKAPGANGSTSQTYCTYASNNPGGAFDDFTALNAVTSAWDGTYWDVWVTHGSHFDSAMAWTWPYVAATASLVFHSDCTQASPCPGTNDLGYNPRGRQVCSHGMMDSGLNPPLPNMGYRNHGCNGQTMGFPDNSAAIPIQPTSPPYLAANSAYNDAANMFAISTSARSTLASCGSLPAYYCSTTNVTAGAVIRPGFGPMATTGPLATACYGSGGSLTGGPCPTDGINHIILSDAIISPDPLGYNMNVVQLTAMEWGANPNPNPLEPQFVAAAPHDIGIEESYFTSDTTDDGFGINEIASMVTIGCVNCWLNHNYLDGMKRDGSEGHGIVVSPPGPTMLVDNWCEGNSICMWGGGGNVPAVCADGSNPCSNGLLTRNTEAARNRVTYVERQHPSPSGIQTNVVNASSWTCASGALVITLGKTVGTTSSSIYWPTIYVTLPTSGITAQWYTATLSGSTATISGISSCTPGSNVTRARIAGYAYQTWSQAANSGQGGLVNINVSSPAVMNASLTCGGALCDATVYDNPVDKNRRELKESQAIWIDAELYENSAVDGQSGQCSSFSVRACSGISKCTTGVAEAINDIALTNSICRHSNYGYERDARSGNHGLGCWGDTSTCTAAAPGQGTLTGVACDATYNNVIDFRFSPNPNILNAPSNMTGTDVYVYNVGSDLSSLLPNGWYQTENISYGSTIPVYIPSGTCTLGHAYTTQGTLIAANNDDGSGVTTGTHHGVTVNNLLYALGNHYESNGSGAIPAITLSSSTNNFSVNVTMGPATGTACTTAGMSPGQIGAVACAVVTAVNTCPAAIYPVSSRPTPDCPLVLQAEQGDLMNVQCPSNTAFSTGAPKSGGGAPLTIGRPIQDLSVGVTVQPQWFTYIPCPTGGTPCGTLPNPGDTVTCPLEPPTSGQWTTLSTDYGSSGAYNNQSYPKTQYFSHTTAVGVNGVHVGGSNSEYLVDLTFKDGILAPPGSGDTGLPGGISQTCATTTCGFLSPNIDTYTGTSASPCTGSGTNATGITNLGDPATLTFLGVALAGTNLLNYPIWQSGGPTCTGSSYAAHANSAPPNTATPGATVTCSGAPCSTSNYSPDSIGFVGATNTNTYPFSLSDWRLYAVSCSYWTSQGLTCPTTGGIDPNSPYKAGNIFQASDGLDNGFIPAYIANAFARTLRPCLLASGCPTYYHDGPQYEWLTWKCTGTCSSFNVYEDGTLVLTTTNLYAQVYGLAVNSSHTWAVTSANGSVSGLTSQMY